MESFAAFLLIKGILIAAIIVGGVLNLAGLHTWLERKQSAVMQDRIGANRASIFGLRILGLFHPLADAIKMLTKENYVPPQGYPLLFNLAPFLSVFFALVGFAAIPVGDILRVAGHEISLQIANINVGLLYILGMMSMGVYGVVIAGFSSNNNFAFLGGMRASSQMISYEIVTGVSLLGIVMWAGSLDLQEIVRAQKGVMMGFVPRWGLFVQPLGFLLFLAAAIAESKRVPFDLPEGESEIIGYFIEYSGMKFGMFYLADFLETIMAAALVTAIFFGGWQVPFLAPEGFWWPGGGFSAVPHFGVVALQVGSFTCKLLLWCWILMMIRWTLPRFRYDQLMRLGWKMMFPLALANVGVTAVILLFLN